MCTWSTSRRMIPADCRRMGVRPRRAVLLAASLDQTRVSFSKLVLRALDAVQCEEDRSEI